MSNRALGVLLGAAVVGLAGSVLTGAQSPRGGPGQPPGAAGSGGGSQRSAVAAALFTVGDADKDGALTRAELKAIFDKWSTEWETAQGGGLGQEQLVTGLSAALPLQPPGGGGGGGGRAPQNQTPNPADVDAMMAALPAKAPARPRQPRKVLVLGKAAGFVHSSIPLAARTIEALGQKTGVDPSNTGRVSQQEFPQRFAAMFPPPRLGPTGFPVQPPATERGPDRQIGTWPEFNRMLGGFFKFHWNDGQLIHVKVDDSDHPLNAPFKGRPQLQIVDETYTFGRDTYSRQNVRVLTSVDYAKMSHEDKAKEQYPRTDGDYALSWIRREGKGRVFYEAHGHNEKIYAVTPILEHVLLGIQYVLGDLEADDRPGVKPGSHED